MKSLILFPIILLAVANSAMACTTVTVNNHANHQVQVVWAAWGCAGVSDHHGLVCESKNVAARSSASYDFNWGTTAPTVYVGVKQTVYDHYNVQYWPYRYHGGKFQLYYSFGGTPSIWCDNHYTIDFTQAHYDSSYND